MAIRTFLGSLGFSHIFMLNDTTRDSNSNGFNTTATATNGSFVADPVCEGVVNSFQANDGSAGGATGVIIGNTSDINSGNDIWREYTISCWFSIPVVDVPTTVYEQGGGTNNQAINVGIARTITSQAADAGQTFLIAQSNFLTETNRPYFVAHVWQHNSVLSGTLNKVTLIINGVLQQEVEGATSVFPSHVGDATIGNAADALQSYNGSTQNFAARQKNVNMLCLGADVALTIVQAREIFERTTLAEVTIVADTVVNQQAALDVLIGNTYTGVNCAIRIIQATDATNYRLFVDNINFTQDSTLRDIAIQFVGTGTLTLENVNGSNVVEVSTPAEIDLDGTTILTGGGSLTVLTDNRIRLNTVQNLTSVTVDKVIVENTGNYIFSNSFIGEIENVSGGTVNVQVDNAVNTLTETDGVISLVDAFLSFSGVDTWQLFANQSDMNSGLNIIATGNTTNVHRFPFIGTETFYLRLISAGTIFLQEITVSNSGETKVNLSLEALVSSLNGKIDEVKENTDRLDSMIEEDAGEQRFTRKATEQVWSSDNNKLLSPDVVE